MSTSPLAHRVAGRDLAARNLVKRRPSMKPFIVKLVMAVAFALALPASATIASAQSRPPSCIPQYDTSGAQTAPYCGP
jgi:hypothetical protein